jgi:tRNA A64-2'-O-ribosylphosphate transferase
MDNANPEDAVIWCALEPPPFAAVAVAKQQEDQRGTETTAASPSQALHLPLRVKKLGSRDLRIHLPLAISFIQHLPQKYQPIYICCPDGKDLSVGVALAIICCFQMSSRTTSFRQPTPRTIDTKQAVRQELAKLMLSIPNANPSRATLQSVHAFLFSAAHNSDTREANQDDKTKVGRT